VEASLPPGSWVYQLPYLGFPEMHPPGAMGHYGHFLPYLHSRKLCWSYGGMYGRDADAWLRQLAEEPLAEQVRILAYAGFAGIYLDRTGYLERAPQVEAELTRLVHAQPLVSADGQKSFFPLAAYVRELRESVSSVEWEARRRRALTPVLTFWRNGFFHPESDPKDSWIWCRPSGELVLKNLADVPRKVRLSMQLQTIHPHPSRLRVRGGSLDEQIPIDHRPRAFETTLVLLPGLHVFEFTCTDLPAHPDPRAFRILNLKCRELD
jgi:hypothetical protein